MLWRVLNRQDVPKALKMVLVVRGDLRLSKGKTSSQCAHAAVMCFEESLSTRRPFVDAWKLQGQPKVVLKVENDEEMKKLYQMAKKQKIVACLVHDAGRTEIPSGTMTVLGLGPDCSEKLREIVGKLKIL
ncbi:uncharacterized protein LOC129792015 [Lutzomyia longipalpis]|uniref:peptidyl-tRNA hydrolase n=1 Tax=Lutzomyia longipalpis TaxID=7200 RepID=A0A7G3ASU1_LUTLO|nr:uncharacterized protein LOC129792015 [Lutzomyia longipalpis]